MDEPLTDTSTEAEERMVSLYRAMPPWRKVELVVDACKTSRQLALTGLRARHPGESEQQLRRRLVRLVLGEQLATAVYGSTEADDAERRRS